MFAMHRRFGLSLLTVGCLTWLAGSGPARGQESPQSEIVVESSPTDAGAPVTLVVDEEQRFRASAMLRIRANRPEVVAESSAAENADRFVRTQVNLLRSRIVLDRVIADPDIANLDELKSQLQPLDYLSQHLRVSSIENSELFLVTFDGKTPEAAAKITNAVLDSYTKIQGDLDAQQRQTVVDLLDREMDRRIRELERLRQSLRALNKESGESETTGKDGKRRPHSEAVQQMWLQAWREEMELAARVQALEETGPTRPAESNLDEAAANDVAVKEVAADLKHAMEEYKGLAQLKPERAERFKGPIKERIATLQAELAVKTEFARQWHSAQQQKAAQAELAQVRLELRTKRYVLERLSTVMNDQMTARERATAHKLDAEFLRQDMARAEANYKAIVDRAEALKLEIRGSSRVGETRRANAAEAKLVVTPRAN